ncbi:hypothetical protein ACUW02_004138, partial [Pseudomonas aeruginosa]
FWPLVAPYLKPTSSPAAADELTILSLSYRAIFQRWGKKWGKNRKPSKNTRHKKIQSPLSDWIS